MSTQEASKLAEAPPILELVTVSKSFGAIKALDSVSLALRAGEVTALVGDNGAGKSTLIKVAAGIFIPDDGAIMVDGEPVAVDHPRVAARLGIEVVYQDLALCDNLDIVANMFLGREITTRLKRLDEATMERRARATLSDLAITTIRSTRQPVATLSGGQRQAVAVARAVMWNSRLVILDEPTAALGVAQTHHVLELISRLAENGLAVLFISHNLTDVFAVADWIIVLRLGRKVGEYQAENTNQQEIVGAITAGKSDMGRRRTEMTYEDPA